MADLSNWILSGLPNTLMSSNRLENASGPMILGGCMLDWPAERFPSRIAIQFEGYKMTSREVDARVNRLANGLTSLGLKRRGIELQRYF
jgi:hypothetical protein